MAKAGFSRYLEELCPLPKDVPRIKVLIGQERLSLRGEEHASDA
jgi:phage FluMu protein Com